jgi:uncharacterized protein YdaU (DUF1376 family)
MSKRAWMPLYVGDYLGDTGHLSTTQHGAYLLLMMHYWRKGELPDDDKQLASITKLPLRIWADNRETLQSFFYDGWKHKRIEAELGRMETVSARRAEAGYKGGIRSAMSRMKLEDTASRPSNSRAIAKQLVDATPKQVLKQTGSNCSNFAEAGLDHSHSPSKKEGARQLVASSELVASLTKRTA